MARRVVEKVIDADVWYDITCERCETYLGLAAKRMWGRSEVDNYYCPKCDPVMVADPDDDFATDRDLRAIDDNYDRERTLAELAFFKAFGKGDRS
jgi:hypothetical protein